MDIRELPEQEPRVETGPTRFINDWCGVFIRGDNAFGYALDLELVIQSLPEGACPIAKMGAQNLLKMLRSSDERFHKQVSP